MCGECRWSCNEGFLGCIWSCNGGIGMMIYYSCNDRCMIVFFCSDWLPDKCVNLEGFLAIVCRWSCNDEYIVSI